MKNILLFLIFYYGVIGILHAESIKQCFETNNLPNRTINSFWIRDADLKDKKIHESLAKKLNDVLFYELKEKHFPVLIQETTKGKGFVFSYKDNFLGWPDLSDTSTLQYLTIYIHDELRKNKEVDLSKDQDVLVMLTKGSLNFMNLCFGYATKGKIYFHVSNGLNDVITNKIYSKIFQNIGEDSILVNIDVQFDTKNINESQPLDCTSCMLKGKLIFKSSL